jgi:hypothetical protein
VPSPVTTIETTLSMVEPVELWSFWSDTRT